MARKILIAGATFAFALSVAACNTVSGAGEDLQSASSTVEDEI
ncbi:entericidin A/B family lipoprotein [Altererythrobacter sp. B11]|nr:entericidin A/B family lipoprotein [Altererythrobacter sp. B11]